MSAAWDSSHAPARSWRTGAWTLELRDDELADIAYDGVVVLRAVRAVVRDRDWDTATTVVEEATLEDAELLLRVRSEGLGASFSGTVRVVARGRDLAVECDLRSAADFATNRTGLVVLHPPSLAGADLVVTHSTGEERTSFPAAISAHQPVLDITGLAWADSGLDLRLRFEGDVFEMEDQRNWTDASFKTYSRPLELPFPYPVAAGEHVRQALRIHVDGEAHRAEPGSGVDRIELRPSGAPFPRIATAASTAPDPAPTVEVGPGPVLVELDLAASNWHAALDRAGASGAELDIRFVLDDAHPEALDTALAALAGRPVLRVTAFASSGPARHVSDGAAIDRLRSAVRAEGIDPLVVGGVRSHFTQLNREHHRLPEGLGGIVFSVTPLFHSLSTEQLVESVAVQRLVAEQAVVIADGLPVHIGPISLRPHFNDVATTPPPRSDHDDLRAGYGPQLIGAADARQASAELAAWTVASAAALAVPGVATLAYFEEWGPRGIRSVDGSELPVAGAISALKAFEGKESLIGSSPDGLIWATGASEGADDAILVANLDRRPRAIVVSIGDVERRATVAPRSFEHLCP